MRCVSMTKQEHIFCRGKKRGVGKITYSKLFFYPLTQFLNCGRGSSKRVLQNLDQKIKLYTCELKKILFLNQTGFTITNKTNTTHTKDFGLQDRRNPTHSELQL